MKPEWVCRVLDRAGASRSFPLARSALGVQSIAAWRDFVACPGGETSVGESAHPAGIMTVEDGGGYVMGLFRFRGMNEVLRGRTLVCDYFAIGDLMRPDRQLMALLGAADALAADHGCAWIDVVASVVDGIPSSDPHGAPAFSHRLQAAGYRMESLHFSKSARGLASGMLSPQDLTTRRTVPGRR